MRMDRDIGTGTEVTERPLMVRDVCGLGLCYALGDGVEMSEEESVRIWRNAAESGNPRAKTLFGLNLSYHSSSEADLYYAHGDAAGRFLLGLRILYRNTDNVSRATGLGLIDGSGETGYGMDEYLYSQCPDYATYLNGRGPMTERLYLTALRWFQMGPGEKERYVREAVSGYGLRNGDRVPSAPLRRRWLEFRAEEGSPSEQRELGDLYAEEGTFRSAVFWWRVASENGDRRSMVKLADAYLTGRGARRLPSDAKEWFELASDMGEAEATYRLGILYSEGSDFFIKDNDLSTMYLIRAANQGHPEACYLIGCRYLFGEDAERSYPRALGYFQLGFERDLGCRYMLGLMFSRGLAVRNRQKQGLLLMETAVDKGFEPPVEAGRYLYRGLREAPGGKPFKERSISDLLRENRSLKEEIGMLRARLFDLGLRYIHQNSEILLS